MPKILNDVMDGLKGKKEKEELLRPLNETQIETLAKEHKKMCSFVADKLDLHIRAMADRGFSEVEVVDMLDSYDMVVKLRETGEQIIFQHRGENVVAKEILNERKKEDEERQERSQKLKKIVNSRLGVRG